MTDATMPEEWVEAAIAAYVPAVLRNVEPDHHMGEPSVQAAAVIREIIAAVAPLIRRAVAEEIAGAIENHARLCFGDYYAGLVKAEQIADDHAETL